MIVKATPIVVRDEYHRSLPWGDIGVALVHDDTYQDDAHAQSGSSEAKRGGRHAAI